MDLAFRKVLGDDGLALMDLVQEMGSFDRVELASIISDRQIKAFLGSVEDLMITTEMIIGKSNDKQVIASIAFDFLMMSSIITAAWRMIEGAQCAKKYEIKEKYTQNFLSSRIANTRTYIDVVLPRYKTHCSIVRCQIDN
jgi:hypothetical protein